MDGKLKIDFGFFNEADKPTIMQKPRERENEGRIETKANVHKYLSSDVEFSMIAHRTSRAVVI